MVFYDIFNKNIYLIIDDSEIFGIDVIYKTATFFMARNEYNKCVAMEIARKSLKSKKLWENPFIVE